MYIGASTDAMPMPTPPTMRAAISTANVRGIADKNADAKTRTPTQSTPACVRTGRRAIPATEAPRMQPTSAALPNQPSASLLKPNCFSTNPNVPEITAVSNPNSNPPMDATRQISDKKR